MLGACSVFTLPPPFPFIADAEGGREGGLRGGDNDPALKAAEAKLAAAKVALAAAVAAAEQADPADKTVQARVKSARQRVVDCEAALSVAEAARDKTRAAKRETARKIGLATRIVSTEVVPRPLLPLGAVCARKRPDGGVCGIVLPDHLLDCVTTSNSGDGSTFRCLQIDDGEHQHEGGKINVATLQAMLAPVRNGYANFRAAVKAYHARCAAVLEAGGGKKRGRDGDEGVGGAAKRKPKPAAPLPPGQTTLPSSFFR